MFYPFLFKKLLSGAHRLWHPDALTYISHSFFDVARITLAAACAAVISLVSAYINVAMLEIRAHFLVWLSVVAAVLVLYVLPFFEHDALAVYAQLIRGGFGNLVMAFVVVFMPAIFNCTALVLANKSLNTDAPKDGAPVG